MADVDLLIVQQHSVDGLDGSLGGLSGLVVNETVALGTTVLIGSDFARQNITEGGERIVKCLQ